MPKNSRSCASDQLGLTPRRGLAPGKKQRSGETRGVFADDRGDRILQNRQLAEERILLKRPSQATAGEIVGLRRRNIVVTKKGLAGMADRVGDRGKTTALAGAVRSDDPEDFAGSYRPADVTERHQRAIAHRQVFNPQHFGAVTTLRFP